jgi:peptide/nickel transport system substrate-binding protein
VIADWVAGDHITLHKNPNFGGAAQGLPHMDTLVFRFTSSGKDALDALVAGECDLADQATGLETQAPRTQELESSGKIKTYKVQNTAWEQVLFDTAPADPKQPVFFGQKEVRQAIAYCSDRQNLVTQLAVGNGQIANSYMPPEDPLYNSEIPQYATDFEKGSQLLATAGWIDADNDPATPRIAQGVPGVPDGTAFAVNYLVAQDELSQKTAGILKESLAKCGIQMNVQAMKWEDLLASGPEGPVFGRHFDLAQFAWALSPDQACRLFLSSEIPGAYPEFPKGWGGANAGGYQNESYDAACLAALTSLPDSPAYIEAQKQAQAVFSVDLPALPLYFPAELLASRPDFCGINANSSSDPFRLNIEELDYAEGCQ